MKRQKSFTLIEILVVIVVIGVLSAFILVGMSSITNSANIAKGKAFFNSMDNSMLLDRVSQWKLDVINYPSNDQTPDSWGTNTCTLEDTTACSFTGTLKCPQPVTSGCPSGNCLSFDGIDDYIDCGNGASLNPDYSFTIAAWFNVHGFSAQSNNSIVDRYHAGGANDKKGYKLYAYSGTPSYFLGAAGDGTANLVFVGSQTYSPISLDKWYYGVMTHSYAATNGSLKLYLNGELKDTKTINGYTKFPSTNGLKIGTYVYWPSVSNFIFNGLIDDVQIYSQTIPAFQIHQNYYIGLNNLLLNNGIGAIEYTNRLAEVK